MKKLHVYEYIMDRGKLKNHLIHHENIVDVVEPCEKMPLQCSIISNGILEYHCPNSSLYDIDDEPYQDLVIITGLGE